MSSQHLKLLWYSGFDAKQRRTNIIETKFLSLGFSKKVDPGHKNCTNWFRIIGNENNDIAIAMSSSRADPVLGLRILQG